MSARKVSANRERSDLEAAQIGGEFANSQSQVGGEKGQGGKRFEVCGLCGV
jgi:hypothetical protein